MRAEQVIFIGGTGRSGTNILKKVFSTHSHVASLPFEYRFTVDPEGVIDFYNTYPALWSPYWADARIKRLESFLKSLAELGDDKKRRTEVAKGKDALGLELTPPSYSGWELKKWIPGFAGFIEDLCNSLVEFRYRALWPGTPEGIVKNEMYFASPLTKEELKPVLSHFLDSCFEAICSHQQKKVLVEDNTHNILFAHDLLTLVPNGKLIHVIRDPRDVISSLRQQRWAPQDLEQCLRWYCSVMDTWLVQRQIIDSHRFVEVRLEDFVREPLQSLDMITRFLGIPMEKQMLKEDLSRHNTGRFKTELNEAEIKLVTNRLLPYLELYGYNAGN